MLLKDAFRYQKFLANLFETTRAYLLNPTYTTILTETHLRKKANPDAEDETTEVVRDKQVDATADQLIDFACHLFDERRELTYAIARAKHAYCDICSYDCELENNRNARDLTGVMQALGAQKSSEAVQTAYDTKFNVNGDQVRYAYEVKRVITIDYDRNKVKRISKNLASVADEISESLDRAKVECNVEYRPKYDVNDTYEDVLQAYLSELT